VSRVGSNEATFERSVRAAVDYVMAQAAEKQKLAAAAADASGSDGEGGGQGNAANHGGRRRGKAAAAAAPGPQPPRYIKINRNVYVPPCRPPPRVSKADRADLVCQCTKEQPCGPLCINWLSMMECDPELCPCGDACQNQRLQRRQWAKVQPVPVGRKGWGLQLLEPVTAGTLITEYLGEVVDLKTCAQRMQDSHKKHAAVAAARAGVPSRGGLAAVPTAAPALPSFPDPDAARQRPNRLTTADLAELVDDVLPHEHQYYLTLDRDMVIDAREKGNVGRFINHSCEPNAITQKWTVNGQLRIAIVALVRTPRVRVGGCDVRADEPANGVARAGALPAQRDIKAGEEITFDYCFEPLRARRQPCYCGSASCTYAAEPHLVLARGHEGLSQAAYAHFFPDRHKRLHCRQGAGCGQGR